MKFNIAIDGTSGVGKSSVAKQLAQHYTMNHLDTGAMYRAIAYFLKDEYDLEQQLENCCIELTHDKVILNGEDISNLIRNDEISMRASDISKNPIVRRFLVSQQQKIALKKGYILDGRDIGSVVLPDAEIKFFMVADASERAMRRLKEYQSKGIACDYNEIYQNILLRDMQDSSREHSPLTQVVDAYLLDTTNKTIEEVVAEAIQYVESKVRK